MKLPTKYKKDIHLIYVKPSGFEILCKYRCNKSNKDIEYWIRINKDIPFYLRGKDSHACADTLLFKYDYDHSAAINDVLAITKVDLYANNSSLYDIDKGIRHETVIAYSGKLRLFSNKLIYPGFQQREIDDCFRYWNHGGKIMSKNEYVEILDYEVAK
jgi:hypothetical protein